MPLYNNNRSCNEAIRLALLRAFTANSSQPH
jgi:hypothetical protein